VAPACAANAARGVIPRRRAGACADGGAMAPERRRTADAAADAEVGGPRRPSRDGGAVAGTTVRDSVCAVARGAAPAGTGARPENRSPLRAATAGPAVAGSGEARAPAEGRAAVRSTALAAPAETVAPAALAATAAAATALRAQGRRACGAVAPACAAERRIGASAPWRIASEWAMGISPTAARGPDRRGARSDMMRRTWLAAGWELWVSAPTTIVRASSDRTGGSPAGALRARRAAGVGVWIATSSPDGFAIRAVSVEGPPFLAIGAGGPEPAAPAVAAGARLTRGCGPGGNPGAAMRSPAAAVAAARWVLSRVVRGVAVLASGVVGAAPEIGRREAASAARAAANGRGGVTSTLIARAVLLVVGPPWGEAMAAGPLDAGIGARPAPRPWLAAVANGAGRIAAAAAPAVAAGRPARRAG
jgi:hypothetical protein